MVSLKGQYNEELADFIGWSENLRRNHSKYNTDAETGAEDKFGRPPKTDYERPFV